MTESICYMTFCNNLKQMKSSLPMAVLFLGKGVTQLQPHPFIFETNIWLFIRYLLGISFCVVVAMISQFAAKA